jgi:hypothetical protein
MRNIAKARALLRGGDRLVDVDVRVIRQKPEKAQDLSERLAWLVAGENDVGDGDRISNGSLQLQALWYSRSNLSCSRLSVA